MGGRWFFPAMSGLNGRVYDFKVTLHVCTTYTDDGIYSDHGYLDAMEILLVPP